MLEEVGGLRHDSAAEQEPGLDEPVKPSPKLVARPLCYLFDQLVAELAPDRRPDLRDLLSDWPEPIEPRDQRGVQCGGDCKGRQWARRKDRGDPVVVAA